MKTTRLTLLAILLAAISMLVACGGGSSSSNPAATFSNASLKGNFTFLALGGDAAGSNSYGGSENYQVGGVLVADGNGHITGGEQTYDNAALVNGDPITGGTYSISSNGLGTITINTADTSIGVNGVETFTVVMVSSSKAMITQFDASATSSGIMEAQTSTTAPTGGYAFCVLGADLANAFPLSFGGVFNIDNNPAAGTISGAGSVADTDDSGSVTLQQTLNGFVASPDLSTSSPDAFGKVAIVLSVGSNSVQFDGYIVDGNHIQLVEDDGYGITGGTAFAQGSSTGSFTANSSFAGNFVYGFSGYNYLGNGADAGVITADGAGNLINGQIDQSLGGSVISDTLTGTYAVDNTGTGRVVVNTTFGSNGTGPSMVFYLTGNGNPIAMQEMDSFALGAGTGFTQGSSAPSFSGAYGLGFDSTDTSFIETDGVAQITANNSAGTFSGTANVNSAFTPATNQTFTGSFSAFAGGRATGTVSVNSSSPSTTALYFIDSTQGFVIETDSNAVTLGSIRMQTQ